MTEPFMSVVTPLYNDEPYIEECIKSILAQTHQNFEYVICDNHSRDRGSEIAKDYAARDKRIRVVSPPTFLPQAQNFNFALRAMSADSKYCKMVLSDDWIYPECLQKMVEVAESDPRVAIVSAYRLFETRPDCFGVPLQRNVFPGRDACRWQLLGTAFPFGSQTTVMYACDEIRRRAPAFFPEDRFHFDVDIAIRVLRDRDFGFVHQVLTYTRDQPGSVTNDAAKFNIWALLLYATIEEYGREFLTPEEFDRRWAQVSRDFYMGLGEMWLKDRLRRKEQKEFWDFQRKYLSKLGVQIQPALLAKGIVNASLRLAGSPLDFAGRVREELDSWRAGRAGLES